MEKIEFLKALKTISEYWAGQNISDKEKCEGVVFSILVLIDGNNSLNDFNKLNIIDTSTGNIINAGYDQLHDLFCKLI